MNANEWECEWVCERECEKKGRRARWEGRSFGLTEEQALKWFEAELGPNRNAHVFATVFRTCLARAGYPIQAALGVCPDDHGGGGG